MNIPNDINISKELSKRAVKVDGTIAVNVDIEINNGLGLVIIYDTLPDEFELIEGNNITSTWKGLGKKSLSLNYKIKCPKKGIYKLTKTKCFVKHVLGMKKPREFESEKEIELKVKPFSSKIEELKRKHIGNLPIPKADVARIGVSTTDFKEVRDYNYSDPLRMINWKATAKRGLHNRPKVNEYEVEGKKTVWIFLDGSKYLKTGSSVENVFEYCVEAADSFTKFFAEKGYLVGMYIYNSNRKMFYPESGKKQYRKISKELIKLELYDGTEEGFDDAVEKCNAYLHAYNPLSIIITDLYTQYSDSFRKGINGLRKITGGNRKEHLPLLILNVLPYSLNPSSDTIYKKNSEIIHKIENQDIKRYLNRIGARVIDWDPKKENFFRTFSREVKEY